MNDLGFFFALFQCIEMTYFFLLQVLLTVRGSALNLTPHLVQKAHSLSIVHLLSYKLGALCCFCG